MAALQSGRHPRPTAEHRTAGGAAQQSAGHDDAALPDRRRLRRDRGAGAAVAPWRAARALSAPRLPLTPLPEREGRGEARRRSISPTAVAGANATLTLDARDEGGNEASRSPLSLRCLSAISPSRWRALWPSSAARSRSTPRTARKCGWRSTASRSRRNCSTRPRQSIWFAHGAART